MQPYKREPYSPQYRAKPIPAAGVVVDRSTERVLSALAHGAIAFGFFGIGFLISLTISGVIWLYSRRSPQVRFHSEQAGCYQCSVFVINVVAVLALGVAGGFSVFQVFQHRSDWGLGPGVLIGLIAFGVWFVGTILYGLVAAGMVLLGKPFKYPIIGDRFARDA
jgi:hypothetical protein